MFSDPSVIAIIVGAVVSLTSLFLNVVVSLRARRLADFLEVTRGSLEFKKQQLDELYGPLLALSTQNNRLAHRLRDIEAPDFHLLDHLPEILNEPDIGPIVNLLLKNNEKMEELLLTKSSLIEDNEFPVSFTLFLGHCGILRSAVVGQPLASLKPNDYYPIEFPSDIKRQFKELKREIDEILKNRSGLLGKISETRKR
jgi:hypothetical protein